MVEDFHDGRFRVEEGGSGTREGGSDVGRAEDDSGGGKEVFVW